MPKLPSQAATKAREAAESSGFTALEAGTYEARLTNVTAKNAASSGNPMWVWELEVVGPTNKGRKLWVNTVLTDAAMWKVAEMFAAFGYDTDTDTDEIIGDHCQVDVIQREIERGARAGQMGNDVQRAYPLAGSEPVSSNGASSDEGVAGAKSGEDTW